jgi:hemolysin activation/secretion protein
VTVVTRDVWSTAIEFNLESIDGKQYGAVGLNERNLLGLGKSVEIVYREDPNGISRTVGAYDPSVLGSRWRFRYSAQNGTSDEHDLMSLGVPFYSEETRHSYGGAWSRNRANTRLYQNQDEVGQIAHRRNAAEVFWGLGNRQDGRVDRVLFSFMAQDRLIGETRALPGADIPPELLGGPDTLDLRRFSIESRRWRPRFVERVNVDRMGAVEDFDLGPSLSLTYGYSFKALGGSADEGYAKILMDVGTEQGFGFGTLRASASSRFRDEPEDIVAQVDGRWVHQGLRHQTQVLAARGILGSRVGRDFQVVVGGLNGLRAYSVHAVAGRRVWRLNAENRWMFAEDFFGAAKLGAVAFADAARAWGAGSEPSQWFLGMGVGFRMTLPRWSPERVLRVDLAWPIDPPREGGHQPVLTFGSSQAF